MTITPVFIALSAANKIAIHVQAQAKSHQPRQDRA
jgi:hypothetical protein